MAATVPIVKAGITVVKGTSRLATTTFKSARSSLGTGEAVSGHIMSKEGYNLAIPKETYFKSRIIREPTRLLPEDLGLNPDLFLHEGRALRGWMEVREETLKVSVDYMRMSDRALGPALNVMASLKKLLVQMPLKHLNWTLWFSKKD